MFDTETTIVDANTDDLDAFNSLLHGHATEAVKEPETPAKVEEEIVEADADALEDDTLATKEDETPDEGGSEEEEADDAEPDPKPKKNRFQERINDLTAKAREAERREAEVKEKLDRILASLDKTEKPVENKTQPVVNDGPTPDDVNEDGSDKYPLGEFDPQYIRDLTRHTIAQEREADRIRQEEEELAFEEDAAKAELATEWSGKLEASLEKYPDFPEKNVNLESTFKDLDPSYGEYLATTIMGMDNGVDVLYHLANNLEEAKRIVASGPAKATLALGRLEARFALQAEEIVEKKLRVSNAPVPPPQQNKGSATVTSIAPDTDDLDAFNELMFPKRKR